MRKAIRVDFHQGVVLPSIGAKLTLNAEKDGVDLYQDASGVYIVSEKLKIFRHLPAGSYREVYYANAEEIFKQETIASLREASKPDSDKV